MSVAILRAMDLVDRLTADGIEVGAAVGLAADTHAVPAFDLSIAVLRKVRAVERARAALLNRGKSEPVPRGGGMKNSIDALQQTALASHARKRVRDGVI